MMCTVHFKDSLEERQDFSTFPIKEGYKYPRKTIRASQDMMK